MAVHQAHPAGGVRLQEPKNQPRDDCPLKMSTPEGEFLDPPNSFFNNTEVNAGMNNPQKRIAELEDPQLNSPQVNDVPAVSIGLGLASAGEQNWHYQTLMQAVAHQFNHQLMEFDSFIQAQAKELRRALAEKMKKHYQALVGAAAESSGRRLREKISALEKAVRRRAKLEAHAAQLNSEVQMWEASARDQAAAVAALQMELQQAMITGCGGEEEQRSTAVGEADDAESGYIDPIRTTEFDGPRCTLCRRRKIAVVVLPCRCFCLCTECDSRARFCPACFVYKSSSIEVSLG